MVFHLWYCHQLPPPARHFASFSLPHYPLMELFHWGFGRGCLFFFLFQVLGWPSEIAGDLWPRFWQLIQVRVLGSHCLSARLRVPSGGVVFEVGGRVVLRSQLAAPPLPPSRSIYTTVPTLWTCPYLWPTPDEGAAELLYLLFQCHHHGQCLLMGLPHISQASFHWGLSPCPPRGSALWGSDVCWLGPCCHFWCLLLFPPLAVFEGRNHLLQ